VHTRCFPAEFGNRFVGDVVFAVFVFADFVGDFRFDFVGVLVTVAGGGRRRHVLLRIVVRIGVALGALRVRLVQVVELGRAGPAGELFSELAHGSPL